MGKTFAKSALALLIIGGVLAGGARQASTQTPPMENSQFVDRAEERLLLGVVLNGLEQQQPRVFLRRNGVFYARALDLQRWRLRSLGAVRVVLDGETFVSLEGLPGLEVLFDQARQVLQLTAPADLFEPNVLVAPTAGGRMPTASAPAAFLNYDLSFEATERDNRTTGFLELGASHDWGLATSTMMVGDRGDGSGSPLRLDTYYLRDDPARLTRFIAGDALTRGTEWSRPIRYAGLRYGTDFGLQPGLLTFPTPVFAGRTSLPSSVELYVNDALRFRGNVEQGPFILNQTPLVTGAGEVTLVVRDVLGVERQVTTPYYVSSRLLRRGLSEYSIELGAERKNYGIESFDYGASFIAGSYRHGAADWLTLEGRAEVSDDVQNIGGGFNVVWRTVGEFSLAASASNSDAGAGTLARAHYSRTSSDWNVSISYQSATDEFAQIGVDNRTEQIREQLSASVGLSLDRYGSFGAAVTDLGLGGQSRTRVMSANYSVALGDRAFANVFLLRSQVEGEEGSTLLGFGLTVPLGSRASAYAQVASNNAMAEYRLNPPTDRGWGYRLSASRGDFSRQEAEVTWLGRPGQVTAQVVQADRAAATRVLASGGVILAGGGAHATRRVDGAFALVETPGQANVRIYQENRLVGRTDAAGRAIITTLRPYDDNRISLAAADLPLDVRIDGDTLNIVPRLRGGAAARFGIARTRGGTVMLQLPDGRPIEPGTPVRIDGVDSFVGYGGEVFVDGIEEGVVLEVQLDASACRAVLPSPPPGTILPRIGPLTCRPPGDSR